MSEPKPTSEATAARRLALKDATIRLVYLTILLVGVSYGLAISLIGVFLKERGFEEHAIGDLAIFFGGGIIAMAVPAGAAIKRIGAKTILCGALFGYALTVGLFPFAKSYLAVGVLRCFDGAFSVCVWVASETVLLSRAPRSDKAFFMSLYAVALAVGYIVGPVLSFAILKLATKETCFYTAGGLALATSVLVAIVMIPKPTSHEEDAETDGSEPEEPLGAGAIMWRIKMSCLATFSYGYFQASVVLFLPLYVRTRGLDDDQAILVFAFFAAGMVSVASFAASWGDKIGHLAVMRLLGVVGTLTIVAFLFVHAAWLVYLTAFIAGASLASLSPVSLALLGSLVPKRQLPQAGGFYNAAYALGMLVGPPISGRLFSDVGGRAMLIHFAVLWTAFVGASILFRRDDPRLSPTALRISTPAS